MTETKKTVELYTDGACSGNPGPGGWGVVLRCGGHEKELYGSNPQTTNNQMELQAAIEGLNAMKSPCLVHLHTDSTYVLKGATEWMKGWKAKGWKTADKKPVKNQEYWEALDAALTRHTVKWIWVRGHDGHPENERADALAVRGRDEARG